MRFCHHYRINYPILTAFPVPLNIDEPACKKSGKHAQKTENTTQHMSTNTLNGFRGPIQQVLFALLAVVTLRGDTTFTFQDGANGYSGAKDASINTQYSQYNGGNGVQWTGDAELGCYTTTGAGAYAVRYLLKFGALTIPAGSSVTSATLTIALDSWNEGAGNITGYYLKNSWDPASTKLGWLHRDASA